jgi:hypothetical protein
LKLFSSNEDYLNRPEDYAGDFLKIVLIPDPERLCNDYESVLQELNKILFRLLTVS